VKEIWFYTKQRFDVIHNQQGDLKKEEKGLKKNCLMIFVIFMFFLYSDHACAEVRLNVVPGIKGIYSEDAPIYLSITIQNSGESFDGEIEVRSFIKSDDTGKWIEIKNEPIYKKKVSVLERENILESIVLPMGALKQDVKFFKTLVYLTKDGKVVSEAVVQGIPARSGLLVSFDERLLHSDIPAWLGKFDDNVMFKVIEMEDLPHDIYAFMTVDCLIITEESWKNITEDYRRMIYEWVLHGGMLVLSGGAAAGEGETFSEISPVIKRSYRTLTGDLNGFLEGDRSVKLAVGDAVRGEILIGVDGVPVAARNNIGKGCVIYSALDLNDVKLNDKVLSVLFALEKFYDVKDYMEDASILVSQSRYLPQLDLPSFNFFAVVWVVYAAAVSFGAYFVLKRLKKRDLMWVVVPVVSVLTLVVIYFSAPFNKFTDNFSNTLAFVNILSESTAQVAAGNTCVAVRGGDVVLQGSEKMLISDEVEMYSRLINERAVEIYQEDSAQVLLKNVPFWSARSISGYGIVRDFGSINSTIVIDGNRLKGRIYNNTGYDVTECVIIINGYSTLNIGELSKGEFKEIKYEFYNISEIYQEMKKMHTSFDNSKNLRHNDIEAVKQNLKDMFKGKDRFLNQDVIEVKFIGFIEEMPHFIKAKGKEKNTQIVVVMQDLEVKWDGAGGFELPAGFVSSTRTQDIMSIIIPKIEHIRPGSVPESIIEMEKRMMEEVYIEQMSQADYFHIDLPEQYKVDIKSVEIVDLKGDPVCADMHNIEVFNWLTDEWEKLDSNYLNLEAEEAKAKYLSQGADPNVVGFKITSEQNLENEMPIYGLTVRGVVKE